MLFKNLLKTFTIITILTINLFAQQTGWFYNIQNGLLNPVQITVPPDDISSILTWDSQQASQIPIYFGITTSNIPTDGTYDKLDVSSCTDEFNSAEQIWSSNSGFRFSSQTQTQGSVIVVFLNNTSVFPPGIGEPEALTPLAAYNNKIVVAPPTGESSQDQNPNTVIYFNGTNYSNRGFYWTVNQYADPNDIDFPSNGDLYFNFQNAAVHELGHLIGMSHDPVEGNIMYPPSFNDLSFWSIGKNDQEALDLLWQITPVCNTCAPSAPQNFSVSVSGQNTILTWSTYTDQSAWGLQIFKNGQPYGNWIQTTQTSFTDANAINSLPATYKISAFNNNGASYSNLINVFTSPSTISYYTSWSGVVYVNSNVVVNSGTELQINPGTKVFFNSGPGFEFTVNGNLSIEGMAGYPVIFTSNSPNPTPGNWGTLSINGSGAKGSNLSYANIQYGTEVDITNANNVTIQNCNITNSSMHGLNFNGSTGSAINNVIENTNTAHGIVVQNSANVTCTGNVIKKTNLNHSGVGIYFGGGGTGIVAQNDIEGFSWGICAIWGSSPTSHNVNYPAKNNRITNCYVGLEVYYSSNPTFGIPTPGDTYGRNSIYGNTSNAAIGLSYSNYPSSVYGCYNYWGYPLNTSLFSVGSGSSFNYAPYEQTDPWSGYPLPSIKQQVPVVSPGDNKLENQIASAQNVVNAPGSSIGVAVVADSLFTGIDLISSNKFSEAKDFFVAYLKNHPDNQAAYTYLYNCADSSTTPDIINYFSSLPSKASKEQKLLLSYLYLKEGNIDLAKKVNDKIIAENQNTPLGVRAKLNNFYIALYNNNDVNTASSLLNEVENESSLSTPVEIATAEDDYNVYGNMLAANSGSTLPKIQQKTEEIQKPTSYSLLQNYPNPFNPTTMISYQVPNDGFVTLKIYDMLGREVKTLVNEFKSQGKYSVTFDASHLASGVYFYQLKSGNYASIKKMILLK